jgi:hypothetical protein
MASLGFSLGNAGNVCLFRLIPASADTGSEIDYLYLTRCMPFVVAICTELASDAFPPQGFERSSMPRFSKYIPSTS